jgi:hypothetical protein
MQIDKDQVMSLEYALIKAIRTSDLEFLDRVLHNDLRFLAQTDR